MLILARHGRTAANSGGLLVGRADPPLDELGRRQAAALAPVLGGAARVVSSPLMRARATAAALGPAVVVDGRWIEVDYGELDLMPVAEVSEAAWEQWRSDPGFAPPGGEPMADVLARVGDACHELAAEVADGDVVVVSHVSPIKAAVVWALGVAPEAAWRMRLDLASVTRLGVGTRGWSLHSFNETAHLAGLAEQG